jgi:hypothetical protein
MADKKISALTGATTPLAGTEVLPIVQSGATVKVANNDLRPKQIQSNATSGVLQVAGPASAATRVMTTPDANFTVARTDAAQSLTGDQTLATGNIIQGTAAKGINFTANTPAAGMTSQLLNWYEEGVFGAASANGLLQPQTSGSITCGTYYLGWYVRTGKMVTFGVFAVVSAVSLPVGTIRLVNLPFPCINDPSKRTALSVYSETLISGSISSAYVKEGQSFAFVLGADASLLQAGSAISVGGSYVIS